MPSDFECEHTLSVSACTPEGDSQAPEYRACMPTLADHEENLALTRFAVQALAKYAFGLGTVTMVACTLVFTGMSLPPGQGLGTQIMVKVSASLPRMDHSRR